MKLLLTNVFTKIASFYDVDDICFIFLKRISDYYEICLSLTTESFLVYNHISESEHNLILNHFMHNLNYKILQYIDGNYLIIPIQVRMYNGITCEYTKINGSRIYNIIDPATVKEIPRDPDFDELMNHINTFIVKNRKKLFGESLKKIKLHEKTMQKLMYLSARFETPEDYPVNITPECRYIKDENIRYVCETLHIETPIILEEDNRPFYKWGDEKLRITDLSKEKLEELSSKYPHIQDTVSLEWEHYDLRLSPMYVSVHEKKTERCSVFGTLEEAWPTIEKLRNNAEKTVS